MKMVCRGKRKEEEEEEEEEVLGLHLTGPNAGEVMQGFAVALRLAIWELWNGKLRMGNGREN